MAYLYTISPPCPVCIRLNKLMLSITRAGRGFSVEVPAHTLLAAVHGIAQIVQRMLVTPSEPMSRGSFAFEVVG